uniref:Uncharacterized protein MANES_06G128200 n=1 Tax=Rhizophora mucronata TaxID=61149 RepID=A0A2P2M1E3_RHIMU
MPFTLRVLPQTFIVFLLRNNPTPLKRLVERFVEDLRAENN